MCHAPIAEISSKVPLMFRAQMDGRCQLQFLDQAKRKQEQLQDAELWADEWIDKAYPEAPDFSDDVRTRTYQLSWRFVTNGRQDDGVIRPVIGARGWPFYPGSSMKGAFRQACDRHQAERYCGGKDDSGEFRPNVFRAGIRGHAMRIFGGLTDANTAEDLVDTLFGGIRRGSDQVGLLSMAFQTNEAKSVSED